MKKIITGIILFISFLLTACDSVLIDAASRLNDTNAVYVDIALGSDTNSGTMSSPLNDIQDAKGSEKVITTV